MKINTLFLILLSLATAFKVHAGSHFGKITKFDLHSDNWSKYDVNDVGILSFYVEGLPNSCNQENGLNRVVITTEHPLFNAVLSTVISAKTLDRALYVNYLDSCKVRDRAWDFGYIGVR